MPRFKVVEQRMYEATYLIDADNEQSARKLNGDIVVEDEAPDSWGYDIVSVEEVDEDAEL
jgi:hypothetical protein